MHKKLEQTRELINQSLPQFIPTGNGHSNQVLDAMLYITLAPGKRIRPIFMLEIFRSQGMDIHKILPSACAIEFIHTASLILDDLPCMDNAKIRRGQPSTHLAFNEYTAILASLSLLMQAFGMIYQNAEELSIDRSEMVALTVELSQTIGVQGMISGQYLDLTSEALKLDREEVDYIHDHKTTLLFKSAAKIAATLCQAGPTTQNLLLAYGQNIGKAFQIVDDILDSAGDPENLGKEIEMDSKKKTYVDLLGIQGAKQEVHRLIERAMEQCRTLPNDNHLDLLARSIEELIE